MPSQPHRTLRPWNRAVPLWDGPSRPGRLPSIPCTRTGSHGLPYGALLCSSYRSRASLNRLNQTKYPSLRVPRTSSNCHDWTRRLWQPSTLRRSPIPIAYPLCPLQGTWMSGSGLEWVICIIYWIPSGVVGSFYFDCWMSESYEYTRVIWMRALTSIDALSISARSMLLHNCSMNGEVL